MARDTGFLHYVTDELLADFPGIYTRAMFGGYGIYRDGIIFAMIIGSTLYFRADETSKETFIARGSKPFSYQHKTGKTIETSYFELPESIAEDRDMLSEWVDRSVQVSLAKKKKDSR